VPGRVLTRIVRPIRFVNPGEGWSLRMKHEGTCTWQHRARMLSKTHSHSVCHRWTGCYFYSNVLVYSIEERRPKVANLQIFALPRLKTSVFLADVATIKVNPLFLQLKQISSTCVRRRSQHPAPDFPNLCVYTPYCVFLDETS
jgi:hypothetical protein